MLMVLLALNFGVIISVVVVIYCFFFADHPYSLGLYGLINGLINGLIK